MPASIPLERREIRRAPVTTGNARAVPQSSAWIFRPLLVATLVLFGAGALYRFRAYLPGVDRTDEPSAAQATTAAPLANEVALAPEAAPPSRKFRITLRHLPARSSVLLDDKSIADNPFEIAPSAAAHTLRIERPGHRPRVFQLKPTADLSIDVDN